MTTEHNTETKTKKKPFKQTRELIRLAIHNGWTQMEIAKACRTQQSVVSAWNKGEKLGNENQLKPLLDIFGHKLRRNSFRLYWHEDQESHKLVFTKVEGKIIFNHVLCSQGFSSIEPKFKIVIHYQGNDKFCLIWQIRNFYSKDKNLDTFSWKAVMFKILDKNKLVYFFDNLTSEDGLKSMINQYSISNVYIISLPFLIRQALLNHGFSVDELIEYPALW